ncbi:MAG: hypothetical protein QM571_06780 [Micrococcaceae bacterium]
MMEISIHGGNNPQGQLGLGDQTDRSLPTLVRSWDFLSTSGGGSHSTAVKGDGTMYGWGRNEYGQLGKGTSGTTNYTQPSSTSIAGTVLFKKLDTHYDHNLAITLDGDLYVWGSNRDHDSDDLAGQLGDGTTVLQRVNPISVSTPGLKWYDVQAGSSHSLGITTDGDLYGWGISSFIGNGATSSTPQLTPEKIGHMKWDGITCSSSASYGVARTFVPKGYEY